MGKHHIKINRKLVLVDNCYTIDKFKTIMCDGIDCHEYNNIKDCFDYYYNRLFNDVYCNSDDINDTRIDECYIDYRTNVYDGTEHLEGIMYVKCNRQNCFKDDCCWHEMTEKITIDIKSVEFEEDN